MYEYSSVNASAYDVDSLVAKLNGRSAEGWDVVSVLSSGGDIVAILKREGTGVSAVAAVAEPVVEAAPAPSYDYAAAAPAATIVEAAPAPVVEAVAPIAVPEPAAPVAEPVGWGASAAETVTSSFDSGTAAVAAAAVAAPAVVAAAAPTAPAVAPAAVVTTPAGWYPDPSGRFEMRYWDGTAWSEHVSRQGQQYTDPPVA
jgi:Protein of unknown function (DUF2510)